MFKRHNADVPDNADDNADDIPQSDNAEVMNVAPEPEAETPPAFPDAGIPLPTPEPEPEPEPAEEPPAKPHPAHSRKADHAKNGGEWQEPAEHPYKHWNREHLKAETDVRRISVREGAEAKDYVQALLADDDFKAEMERQNRALNG